MRSAIGHSNVESRWRHRRVKNLNSTFLHLSIWHNEQFYFKKIQGFYVLSNRRLMPMSLKFSLGRYLFCRNYVHVSYSCREFDLLTTYLKMKKIYCLFLMNLWIIHIFMSISYGKSPYTSKNVKFIVDTKLALLLFLPLKHTKNSCNMLEFFIWRRIWIGKFICTLNSREFQGTRSCTVSFSESNQINHNTQNTVIFACWSISLVSWFNDSWTKKSHDTS